MILSLPILDQAVYALVILLGLAACFFGYRLLRFWLALAGLETGFYLGLWLGGRILNNPVLIILLAVVGAILLGGLFLILVKVGGFLAGAGILVLLVLLAAQLFGTRASIYVLLGAVLAGGILGVLAVKPFLILATAFNGAWLVADGLSSLIGQSEVSRYVPSHEQLAGGGLVLLLIGVAFLTVLGSIVQFRMERKRADTGVQPAAPAQQSAPAETKENPPDDQGGIA